jgi:pSer/pThr/pTyr-binding forkhead associated (FHA) protein
MTTLLTIAAVISGLLVLAGLVALVARWLKLFRTDKATVQMQAIADPSSSARSGKAGTPATALVAPQLRETSVRAWAARVVVMKGPALTIGRSLDSDLVLVEDAVSAEHCRLERQGSAVRLIDLGSTNQTWVNGRAVTEAVLRNGDEIRVGHTRFVLEWPGDRS